MSGDRDSALKAIIDASKGNIDFLAFALIAILSVGSLTAGVAFWSAAGMGLVLASAWIASRYALLAIQSRERLRTLRETATIEAQKKLADHATEAEVDDLFAHSSQRGDDNEL